MKNKVPIQIKYLLSAVLVVVLIGSMFYRALPRWDVCYTADFPGMHVELYPQRSVSNEYDIYRDFILRLNDTSMRKNWEWKAGLTKSDVCAPSIYYADLNGDQQKELLFHFQNGVDRGTGVLREDIYVVNSAGNDHAVEDPGQYLREHSKIALSRTATGAIVDLAIEETVHQLVYPKDYFPDFESLEPSIGYPDWVEYHLKDNRLSAEIPFVVYACMTIGSCHLQYEEIDGSYAITDVRIAQLPKEKL